MKSLQTWMKSFVPKPPTQTPAPAIERSWKHFGDGIENPWMKQIRLREKSDPAPFSNKEIIIFAKPESLAMAPERVATTGNNGKVVEDVPISKIVGILNDCNLEWDCELDKTFSDALFYGLHGRSLTEETLDWFLSPALKADHMRSDPAYVEYPQDKSGGDKSIGRKGVELTRRGDKFYVNQGKQRTLLAMYWIYQNHGINGVFRGVGVEG